MGTDLIRWLARAICWIFYRVDREGAVPADGPVLILPNHGRPAEPGLARPRRRPCH